MSFVLNDVRNMGISEETRQKVLDAAKELGYDDTPLAAFATPPLTTLRIDPVSQGTEAVDNLVAQMNGEPYTRQETACTTTFIVRESCGSRGNAANTESMPYT